MRKQTLLDRQEIGNYTDHWAEEIEFSFMCYRLGIASIRPLFLNKLIFYKFW